MGSTQAADAGDTGWTDLCALDDVATGQGLYVEHDDLGLAVLRPDAEVVRVLENRCPHAGGALAAGAISDDCVICPWHGWAFELKSGRCPDAPQIAVRTFRVRVAAGRVEACLDGSHIYGNPG